MPAKNLGQIRSRALELILDTDNITANMVDEWIQDGQAELEDRYGFRAMIETVEATTTAATRKVADLPSDWCRERAKPWYLATGDVTKRMDWIQDAEELDRLYSREDADDDGRPAHVLVNFESGELEVYPFPDSNGPDSGNYKVRVPYLKRLDELTVGQGNATNWFTDQPKAVQYLEYFAAAKGAEFNRDSEAELGFLAKAEAAARKLIAREKAMVATRTTVLRPRRDVLAPASQPRMT